jgi:hypothetical protein
MAMSKNLFSFLWYWPTRTINHDSHSELLHEDEEQTFGPMQVHFTMRVGTVRWQIHQADGEAQLLRVRLTDEPEVRQEDPEAQLILLARDHQPVLSQVGKEWLCFVRAQMPSWQQREGLRTSE